MDFDDLLIQWRRLLREFPEIRDYYAERFLHVLVDDTRISTPAGEIADLLAIHHRILWS